MANTEQPSAVSPEQAQINANAAFAQFQELYNSAMAQKTVIDTEIQRLGEHLNKLRNDSQMASNQAVLADQSIKTLQNVLFFQPPVDPKPVDTPAPTGPADIPVSETVAEATVEQEPAPVAEAEAEAEATPAIAVATKAKKVKI